MLIYASLNASLLFCPFKMKVVDGRWTWHVNVIVGVPRIGKLTLAYRKTTCLRHSRNGVSRNNVIIVGVPGIGKLTLANKKQNFL